MEGFGARMEELATELVRIKSVVGTAGEAEITAWIHDWLARMPYFVEHPEELILHRLPGELHHQVDPFGWREHIDL